MKLKREVVAAHERYGMILGDDHKLAKHIKGSLAETPPLTIEAARSSWKRLKTNWGSYGMWV